jgi:thymidylate kinase
MNPNKLIVLDGPNGSGKSEQITRLISRMKADLYFFNHHPPGVKTEKFPRYSDNELGKSLHDYLREENPAGLTGTEFQLLNAAGFYQAQSSIQDWVRENDFVILESYFGTCLAWSIATGVDPAKIDLLKTLFKDLVQPDLTIIFTGATFGDKYEEGHKHESTSTLINKVSLAFTELAEEYGWTMINIEGKSIDEVAKVVFDTVLAMPKLRWKVK